MKNILLFILIFYSLNIYANDLFKTSFYNIEFSSKSIEKDKILEINKIKKQSFFNILKKSLINKNFKKLNSTISEDLINTFVKNIIINDEIIINEKYRSKIKINFDKKKIISFLREKKIPYVEFYPEKILLIIYEKNTINENLFSKSNKFYTYINNTSDNYLFKIPNLDINDRYILNKDDIINQNYEKINNFSNKYNLKDIIVVLINKNENNITYSLALYSNDNVLEKKLQFNKYKFDEFFDILQEQSIDLWKTTNQIQNTSINLINCSVNYFNLLELKEIRNNLNNISIIKDLNIKSISFKNIEYEIYFFGNLKILLNILHLNKLKINKNENDCNIRLK